MLLHGRFTPLLVAVALWCGHAPVRADPPPERSGQVALAETLFREGKALMADGRYAAACPKLAESHRLDPAGGTLLALAVCHEAEGKTATAWAEFVDARAAAERDGREDRVAFADERIRALDANLSRITIEVPPEVAHLSGVAIERDGLLLGPAAWGTPTPVDPGTITLRVRAPGKQPWSTRVAIGPGAEHVLVTVPPLRDAAAPGVPEAPPSLTPLQIGGIAVGTAGLASIAAGTYFGVQAIDKSDQAKARCSPESCTDPNAVAINDEAETAANVANVTIALGAAALVAGTVMIVLGSSGGEASARLELSPLGAAVRVSF